MDDRPDQVRHGEGAGRKLSRERGEINPNPAATDDELESLRLELAQTRAQMSETVYALQGRLNPQYVREQASSQAKDTAKQAGSNLSETIKQNPIPAALTGAGIIGLGWLIASGRDDDSQQRSLESSRYESARFEDGPHYYERSPEYPAYYEDETRELGSSSEGRSRTQEASGQAREKADQARERASQMGGQLQDRANEVGGQAQQQAQRAKSGFQRMLQENPLAVGAIAAGIGAAVGFSIPESEKENQLMGEKRDQLANQGQQRVRDYQDRAQSVAKEARSAAEEEASNQDLKS